MKRKKVIELLVWFFLCMFVFTLLSRAAQGVTLARVRTSSLQNQMIVHRVTGSGRVEGTVSQGVFTEAGMQVETMHVQEGQKVAQGDVLFQVNAQVLQNAIAQLGTELEKLTLTAKDLESKQALEAKQQENVLARAQEDYQLTIEKGDIAINSARANLQTAVNKLNSLYARSNNGETGLGPEINAQQEAVKASRDALNDVIIQRNDAVKAAQRAIEDAKLPTASDSSLETNEIDRTEKEENLLRLKELQENQGQVYAPKDGVVTGLAVQVGSVTTSEACAVLTLYQGDYRLTGTVDKDSVQYVERGASVTLKNSSGKEVGKGTVEQIQEDDEQKSMRKVVISVPSDSMELGEMGEFVIAQEEGPFAACVPLQALHEDNGSRFVYVLDKSSSILGEELVARKVTVQVQDKNEQYAALAEGAITNTDRIIISSDREIQGGSRVRLEES